MPRERSVVQAFTGDGPILVAIHDVLADLYDLLDARLPRPGGEGPVPVKEPAPTGPPDEAIPVREPAPDDAPAPAAKPVTEPDRELPKPPPTAGRGSSQQAWAAWATAAGIAVTDGMTRDDIISACRTAGVLPEQ